MSGKANIIITVRDMRAADMCSRGSREFFARHGLNWVEFLRTGIRSDLLEATGDAMALQVVEKARNGR